MLNFLVNYLLFLTIHVRFEPIAVENDMISHNSTLDPQFLEALWSSAWRWSVSWPPPGNKDVKE